MNTNDTFSIRRFAALLRWTLLRERRFCMRAFATAAVALLVVELVLMPLLSSSNGFSRDASGSIDGPVTGITALAVMAVMWCALVLGFTMIMHDCATRRQALCFIMLPATRTEKALMRLLAAGVGSVAMLTAALAVADVARMGIQYAAAGHAQPSVLAAVARMTWGFACHGIDGFVSVMAGIGSGTDAPLGLARATVDRCGMSVIIDHTESNLADTAGVLTTMLYMLSLAACCGMLVRRVPWLATAAVACAVSLVEVYAGIDGAAEIVADLALTAVFAALAWTGFCRMQITNNKWINL